MSFGRYKESAWRIQKWRRGSLLAIWTKELHKQEFPNTYPYYRLHSDFFNPSLPNPFLFYFFKHSLYPLKFTSQSPDCKSHLQSMAVHDCGNKGLRSSGGHSHWKTGVKELLAQEMKGASRCRWDPTKIMTKTCVEDWDLKPSMDSVRILKFNLLKRRTF